METVQVSSKSREIFLKFCSLSVEKIKLTHDCI